MCQPAAAERGYCLALTGMLFSYDKSLKSHHVQWREDMTLRNQPDIYFREMEWREDVTREMRLKDDTIVTLVRVREGSGCFKAALVLMNRWGCDGNIGDGYSRCGCLDDDEFRRLE